MILRDEVTGDYINIKCDECEEQAPPAPVLLANSGLINMGWDCSGGKHLCPTHNVGEVKYGRRA